MTTLRLSFLRQRPDRNMKLQHIFPVELQEELWQLRLLPDSRVRQHGFTLYIDPGSTAWAE